ncbi:four helix bundle protein [Chromobacterium haemolyticum]|nr:four helix bundle protein [Chromobacterium haemolyticum]
MLERLQVVELTLRLSHDLRLIAPRQYAGAIELTDKIGRQATGWRKSLSSASPAD